MASRYEKKAKKYIDPYRKKAVGDALELYQEEAKDTRKYYDNQIFEEGRAYEDQYRENAVQKAINERQVAESMANMGLSDSGLNRTQATAINLSYANNKANIDRAKRQAIDNIELQKTNDLATIRKRWLAERNAINQSYDQAEADYANDLYSSAYKGSGGGSRTTPQSTGFITTNGGTFALGMEGTVGSNNIRVLRGQKDGTDGYWYIDDTTGKKSFFALGVNPFTGTTHNDAKDENGYYDSSRVWAENGYQPKYIGDIELKRVKYTKDDASGKFKAGEYATYPVYGIEQKIWTDGKGKYYVWDKYINDYIEVPNYQSYYRPA